MNRIEACSDVADDWLDIYHIAHHHDTLFLFDALNKVKIIYRRQIFACIAVL